MSDTGEGGTGLVVVGAPPGRSWNSAQELLAPAVLLRALPSDLRSVALVYRARRPTVAFSSRDLRSSGIGEATRIARRAGFACIIRSPGGRMVAYDDGAVIVDHITRPAGTHGAGHRTFELSATRHLGVLRSLSGCDLRIGAVAGEYCPGEFSINVAGEAKVLGSAQRIAAGAALFSTVVQVEMSQSVRRVIVDVSSALGYPLRKSSLAGLRDFDPALQVDQVLNAHAAAMLVTAASWPTSGTITASAAPGPPRSRGASPRARVLFPSGPAPPSAWRGRPRPSPP